MVWSYHCSETCFSIVFFPVMAFDHINVGCPAAEGNELLLDSCSSYFLPDGSVIYPV